MSNESQGYKGPAHMPDGEGKYANYFQIGHNAFEFVVDFGQFFSNGETERWHTRIVTTPREARELHSLLSVALEKYEANFGAIAIEDTE